MLPGAERPKFKSLLYQPPACRQQLPDCYPKCPFHSVAVLCVNIQMDHMSIHEDYSLAHGMTYSKCGCFFLSLGGFPLITHWWDGRMLWVTQKQCRLEAARAHHPTRLDLTLSQSLTEQALYSILKAGVTAVQN